MKNTDSFYQDMIDNVNRTRKQEHDKIQDLINQLTAISIIAHSLIQKLEQDPCYMYGNEPIIDGGPAN